MSTAHVHRPFVKRLALCAVLSLLAASLALISSNAVVRAGGRSDAIALEVLGSPLGNISISPLSLSPTFTQATTDYVVRSQAGIDTIQLTLTAVPGGTITTQGSTGHVVVISETLVENQALIVEAPDPNAFIGASIQYWIRSLPRDFPRLTIAKPGTPPPGWYLTGNLFGAAGSGVYAMVLDANGTPVWYQKSAGEGVQDVTPLSTDAIAWGSNAGASFGVDPNGAFQVFNLTTQTTQWLAAPSPPTDFHELLTMPMNHLMLLSTPLKSNVDIRALNGPSSATIVDCLIQEVDRHRHVIWEWRASDHISVGESTRPASITVVRRQAAYDIFHCNSIDVDPLTANVLVSARHTDAVYLIRKTTGKIVWRIGGGATPNRDRAQVLAVTFDPEGAFHAQHDARFQPNGDISLYDNESWDGSLAARGVEYHVDTKSGTASLVWSYSSPDGHNSAATGSFRRLSGGSDNVIGWGIKPGTLFTEVDAAGNLMLDVTFPSGQAAYRVIKVAPGALDHNLLRATAGLPKFVVKTVPSVSFVAPASGPNIGGTTVTIGGAGFSGASNVAFGSVPATSFTANSNSSITAIAPPGCGVVSLVVAGPGGESSVRSSNQLLSTASDSSFESGTGSWTGGSNTTVAVANAYAHSGVYSIEVSSRLPGGVSATTGKYAMPAGATVLGGAYVLSRTRVGNLTVLFTFYDSRGAILSLNRGPERSISQKGWIKVQGSAVAPPNTASVAIGVAASASTEIYLDDAVLKGSLRFSYVSAAAPSNVSAGGITDESDPPGGSEQFSFDALKKCEI